MSWVPDTPLISNYLSKQPQRRKPYPPYDIDPASNKYAYIYIAFLTETMYSLSLDGYWIMHTCLPPNSIFILSHLCFIFGVNIYVLFGGKQKKKARKKKNLSKLNRLASKINDKMGAQALFSRSHLNISFRDIDLFCVTYPGPFFVIKRERVGNVEWGLSQSCGKPSCCVRVCVSVYTGVFLCG